MTTTGAPAHTRPRGPQCEFQMLSAPAEGFTEIGVVDVKPGGYGSNVFTDIADFKEKIRPYVCQAGGDAALVVTNGYGMYIKATVLKRAANAIAPAAVGANVAQDGGCKYDTQCKGDRICVAGTCQAQPMPSAAPAPPTLPSTTTAR